MDVAVFDGDDESVVSVAPVEGFVTAELNRNVDLVAAYKKWKDQREFPWFYKEWLLAPMYPIKLRPGQTFDSRRLEQIIADFGFKRPTVVTARGSASLPIDQLSALRKMLTNLIARQTAPSTSTPLPAPSVPVAVVAPRPAPVVVSPPSPVAATKRECDDSERVRVEKVLQGVLDDMTALTQERDQLRILLDQAKEELQKAKTAVPSVPPSPQAPLPARAVPKPVVMDLLADIRKGKTLKPSGELTSKKTEAAESSSGLEGALAKALANRRGGVAGRGNGDDDDDKEAANVFAASELISCEMCYSVATDQCALCKSAYYCSRDCQVQHWTEGGHKHACSF